MNSMTLVAAIGGRPAGRVVLGPLLAVWGALLLAPAASGQTIEEWLRLRWQLWRVHVDGSELQPIDQTPGYRCGSPDWSPDGRLIAYDVMIDGEGYGDAQVAVIRPDGTDRRMLGSGAVPGWSPDGKLIICQTNTAEATVVMNPDGSGRETIFPEGFGLRWSPHANQVFALFNRTGEGGGIYLFDLESGTKRQVFPGPSTPNHGYGVSPDGLRLCFGAGENPFADEKGSIGVMQLDEKTKRASLRWLVDSGIGYHASWAPDGRRFAYAWRPSKKDKTQIYVIDVDSDEPPKLLPGLDTSRHNVNPDWSPDGETIVFSSSEPPEPSAE